MCRVLLHNKPHKEGSTMTNTTSTEKRQPKHLAEPDGAPLTREEVTSGYVNPSQERMAAWEQKQAARR